jgi:lysophospholipase L1-like esterase
MAAPCAPDSAEPRSDQYQLEGDTVRQIVHLSIGGLGVRLRFSNTFGITPLVLRSVHVAQRKSGNAIDPTTDKPATFSGQKEVSIAPGKSIFSDPVNLPVTSSTDIAVSFFVPEKVTAPAIHYTALQTSYIARGDQSDAESFGKSSRTTTLRLILTGVDVATRSASGVIVAIGSSTTDGAHSTLDANHRWTDELYARLATAQDGAAPAVLNAGISGNRVLHDGDGSWGLIFGQSAVARFQRDVLAQSGITSVILFEGGNDIRRQNDGTSAQQLIAGFQLLAQMAHDHHLKFSLGTITPFEPDSHEPEDGSWERTRQAVNQWVRTTRDVDGVVDFDAAIRDPHRPSRILLMYDSGDHLHPNDAGYKAMADSIDLSLFSATPNGGSASAQ